MLDLNAILGQLTNTAQQRQQNVVTQLNTMNAETALMQNMMDVNVQEATQVAQTASEQAKQAAAIQYTQNKVLENAQTVIGLNPDDINNELNASMAAYNQAETERKAVRQQVDKLSQISLLDNPLGWIAAQLQLPQVAAQNNALVDQRDAAAENITTRQRLLTAHRSAVTANTADSIKELKIAEADNQLKAAQVKLREAQIDNISKISGRNLQAYQLSDKLFDIESDLFNKKLQITQTLQQSEMLAEQRAANREIQLQRLEKMKKEAAFEVEFNSRLEQISGLMGRSKPMTLQELELLPAAEKNRWLMAAGNARLGEGLVESLGMLATADQTAIARTNPGFASSISGYTEQLRVEMKERAKKLGKQVEQLSKQELAQVRDEAEHAVTNMFYTSANGTGSRAMNDSAFDSKFHPYKLRHTAMLDMIATKPEYAALKDNALVKALQTVSSSSSTRTYDSNLTAEQFTQAINTVAESVKAKTISPEKAAADIANYVRLGAAANLNHYQYTNVGLLPAKNYVVDLGIKSVKGGTIKFDATNELQTKQALIDASISTVRKYTNPMIYQKEKLFEGLGF